VDVREKESFTIESSGCENDSTLAARMQEEERQHQEQLVANQSTPQPRSSITSVFVPIHSTGKINVPITIASPLSVQIA
jgi:hypothetical protein